MKVKIRKLNSRAFVPVYQTVGAAAVDLHTLDGGSIFPGQRALVASGLAFEIPKGFVGLVCSRSGLALKEGIFVMNAPGVIDSDYRGDVGALLFNSTSEPWYYAGGDRIAQLMIVPVEQVKFELVDELGTTARGLAGWGSTGYALQA